MSDAGGSDDSDWNNDASQDGLVGTPKQRRFRKRDEVRQQPKNTPSTTTMQMKLNRLSDREVDDSKMASVFGQSQHKRSPNSLRLNPLYAGGVKTAKNNGNEYKQRRKSYSGTSNTSQSKKEMNGKKRSKEAEDILSPTPDGAPVISYKDNFKLKDKSAGHGKSANLKQMGRVMPARVKKNTLKTSLQSFEKPKPTVTHKPTRMDVEEAFARARIRRGWRYVIMIILAFLVFCLLITIVLLFATQDSRTT